MREEGEVSGSRCHARRRTLCHRK